MLFAFAAVIFRNAAVSFAAGHLALTVISSLLATVMITFPVRAANETIDFRPAAKAGSFRQSKVIVEVEGKLKLNADGKEVKHLPFTVQG